MAISSTMGTHVLSNDWMNRDENPSTMAPGHAGYDIQAMLRLAAESGANVVRIPLSLQNLQARPDGSFVTPFWMVEDLRAMLTEAASRTGAGQPLSIIFQISDTPFGVASSNLAVISKAVTTFTTDLYSSIGPLASAISAFEFGNEPNEYFSGAYRNSGADFADYITAMTTAVHAVETSLNVTIPTIAGGIVYNDSVYMQQFFARLGKNPELDGFSIHPYTLPLDSTPTADSTPANLASRRPTEWLDPTTSGPVNDFQGAIYNIQQLMNDNGYGDKTLSVTEIGVPSWLGARNAGADGRDDQARWIAETAGVLDSWDNRDLKALVFHATLDFELGATNDQFSVYDANTTNNNNGSFGETAFGLFERKTADGPVQAKAAAYVLEAMRGVTMLDTTLYPENMADVLARLRVVVGQGEAGTHDVSAITSGAGITNGYTILAQGGDDTIVGSAFNDVVFAGDGNDNVSGNDGADRLYGGAGHDTIKGGAGDDDIYGNTGNDVLDTGTGTNRVDGGTGFDWLVMSGKQSDYTITGDGVHLTITGTGVVTDAYNTEMVVFLGDGSSKKLANANINHGNGLTEANASVINSPATFEPLPAVSVTEDTNATDPMLMTQGNLTVSDKDVGESAFRTIVVKEPGTLGSLSLASDGTFTYQVSNDAVQFLGEGVRKTEIFTVTTVDGTSTQVNVDLVGTDDAAVIGTPTVADVTENVGLVGTDLEARGTIAIKDIDANEDGFRLTTTPATGNLGNLTLAKDGSYIYRVANADIASLNDSETQLDRFTVTSLGGTTQDLVFTVHGASKTNTQAVIGTATVTAVTEDVGVVAGSIAETGSISVDDPDAGENAFQTSVLRAANNLGTMTLSSDGSYTYSVINADIQQIAAGQTVTDVFTVRTLDGTSKDISFTIEGANDVATIGAPSAATLTEDVGVVAGLLSVTGTIPTSDVDTGQTGFITTVTAAAGNLGTLTLAKDGTYTYSITNSAVQSLDAASTRTETFTLQTLDGTTKDVSFSIQGANDAATIGAPSAATLTEDVGVVAGLLSVTGTIPTSDIDTGQTGFITTVTAAAGNLGTLMLAKDGTYTYSIANSAVQSLDAASTRTETFTIQSLDGTSKDVSFTIQGANEPVSETLFLDQAPTQWLTGTTTKDVFVISDTSATYHSGYTLDGKGIVVWNGAKFDILTGFDTLRFTDRDVTADANGRFMITPGDKQFYETLYQDTAETQWVTGTSGNDVFVYNTSSANFGSARTLDGQGTVVWNGAKFDILTSFETLRFTDKDVRVNANGFFDIQNTPAVTVQDNIVQNVAGTQHLAGIGTNDIFVVGAAKAGFGYGKTLDGAGIVVWNGPNFDILNGFETLRFTDGDVLTSSIV